MNTQHEKMKKIVFVIKQLLICWGAISLIGAIGIVGFIVYEIGLGNRSSFRTASSRDVGYFLNWCKLGEERIDKVVHSYVSERSFTGDHLDAHAIKITYVKLEELKDADRSGWYRGDQLPQVLIDAVDFVGPWA